jgi:serine/threonine protein kinase
MASRVGKYLLFETLGEGAFGKVKLGVHEETGEQVAVKIMDKSCIKAQEMTMNVRREIAIMKALKHPNIVNLRCVLTSNSKLYIVMDVVTGGELFTKILNEGKLEENVARSYFQQLIDGVDYCHRRGVCHRDLKPENLLIDETVTPAILKITDFGLSAFRATDTAEELLHTQCGSRKSGAFRLLVVVCVRTLQPVLSLTLYSFCQRLFRLASFIPDIFFVAPPKRKFAFRPSVCTGAQPSCRPCCCAKSSQTQPNCC